MIVIRGKVEFIGVKIGHAGIMVDKTYKSNAIPFSAAQSDVAHSRVTRGAVDPNVDNAARAHDMSIFKNMYAITKLAHDRLLSIIHRRQRFVHELPRTISWHRSDSVATPAHTMH